MPWEEKREFLQDYVIRLYHACYTEKFRHDVVRQSLARYEGMVKADRDGQHPPMEDHLKILKVEYLRNH